MKRKAIYFLRISEVLRIVPYSSSHIWRLEKQGKFPKRVHLGRNRVAWIADEIEKWAEEKISESRPDADTETTARTPVDREGW